MQQAAQAVAVVMTVNVIGLVSAGIIRKALV